MKWFGTCTDIDDMKRAEEQVRQLNRELEGRVEQRTAQLAESEKRVRRKLESILSPQGDLGQLELADLLDIPAVKLLVEGFCAVTHIPTALIDLQGNFIIAVGLREVCTKFHRQHPETCRNCRESDIYLSAGVAPGEFKVYKCKNNLWDVSTPIMVGGKHLGNLFTGQFLFADEPFDEEGFRHQARKYGFDENEYLGALQKTPRVTRQFVNECMAFLASLTVLCPVCESTSASLARKAMHSLTNCRVTRGVFCNAPRYSFSSKPYFLAWCRNPSSSKGSSAKRNCPVNRFPRCLPPTMIGVETSQRLFLHL